MTDSPKTDFRIEWTASVPANRIKDSAMSLAEYHRRRGQHWTAEEEKATTAYRESIQVREHEVTGGKQVGVAADQEKASHLSECKAKRDRHRGRAEEFEQWAAFLGEMGNGELSMTASDARYFRFGMEKVEE